MTPRRSIRQFAGLLASAVCMPAFWLASGCVMVYAPAATRFSAYSHDQQAAVMPIKQEIQPSAQLVRELTGISAGNNNTASASVMSGNTGIGKARKVEPSKP